MTTTKKAPTLQQIRDTVEKWQRRTFPTATSYGAVEHLAREANELRAHFWRSDVLDVSDSPEVRQVPAHTIDVDAVAEEAADVFFMLVALECTVGFDLRAAVAAKLVKNMERRWGAPDERGVIEHDRM